MGHAVAQLVEALCVGSIPDGVTGIFIDIILPPLRSTQLLTEMSIRKNS